MEFPEAEDMMIYIMDQERMDKAWQLWLTGDTTVPFGRFYDSIKPQPKETTRSREEIYAETDKLFDGR